MQTLGKAITIPANARLGPAASKTTRYGPHYEIIIGIGKDNVAYLTLDEDALKALQSGDEINVSE
jgi:hypothetical protein